MSLKLRLQQSPQQKAIQRCTTCTQPIGNEPDLDAATEVVLCGAEKYVVCPTCNKVVPEELRTTAYEAKYRQLVNEKSRTNSAQVSETGADVDGTRRHVITPEEWLRDREAFEARLGEQQI